MIKVTLHLKNGLSSASPNGELYFCLPPGSRVADLRRQALHQLGKHPQAARLQTAQLLLDGRHLDDASPLPMDRDAVEAQLDANE